MYWYRVGFYRLTFELVFGLVLCFVLVSGLTYGIISLYIIYYTYTIILSYYTILLLSYTYIIISYTILFSSSDLFLSFPTLLSLPFQSSSDLFLSSSSSPLLLFLPFPIFLSSSVLFSHSSHSSSLSPLPIPGIPVGTYLCLFILQSHLQDILTPHVLSEWMVEV